MKKNNRMRRLIVFALSIIVHLGVVSAISGIVRNFGTNVSEMHPLRKLISCKKLADTTPISWSYIPYLQVMHSVNFTLFLVVDNQDVK